MPEIDGAAMLRALAQRDTLRVFAAVVDATGTGAPQRSGNGVSITWTTVRGVSRRSGLPETAVVSALEQLTKAHLIAASPAGDGWHTDFSSLSQAVESLSS
jgi:hypothetical protein